MGTRSIQQSLLEAIYYPPLSGSIRCSLKGAFSFCFISLQSVFSSMETLHQRAFVFRVRTKRFLVAYRASSSERRFCRSRCVWDASWPSYRERLLQTACNKSNDKSVNKNLENNQICPSKRLKESFIFYQIISQFRRHKFLYARGQIAHHKRIHIVESTLWNPHNHSMFVPREETLKFRI